MKNMFAMFDKSHVRRQISGAFLIIAAFAFSTLAQDDPNPDSPTPILISEPGAPRALANALNSNSSGKKAFQPNQRIVLYATNLQLMDGEGASAFRITVRDARNREFRFPVLNIEPLAGREWIYALTVELKDTLGYWKRPKTGDLSVALTWRGLASNRLRLGFGKSGGNLKDASEFVPSPMPSAPLANNSPSEPDTIGYVYSGDRTRLMEQATFGPTTALDARIHRIGLRAWLNEQLNATYPTVPYPDIPLMPTAAQGDCNGDENPNTGDPPDIYPNCFRDRYTMFPVQTWFFKEAFYGEAQLKHRVAWALSQMWVVSGLDTQQSSYMVNYHQVLSRNAFGNYRTLMSEMTLNAAMGNYLDMARSTKNSPNENYAREILQLFSIGVYQLNQDGTLKLDQNNEPIPTYNQTTVNNFSKVFTGWTFCDGAPAVCPSRTLGTVNYKDPLLLKPEFHDTTEKTLLDYPDAVNREIEADLDGSVELQKTLDNIYNHPNVAPFVSRFLIQHLVTSDPTPACIGRVAAVFNQNRENPAQMREVVKAILLDPEARGNVKTDPHYGKLREPVQLATNLLRQLNVESADGATPSDGYLAPFLAPLGQNVFYSPNVFNYYAPDYVVPGPGLNGPEFGLMTTGTAVARTNFINRMIFDRIPKSENTDTGTAIDLTELRVLSADDHSSRNLLDWLDRRLMHGTMTAQNRQTILTAVQTVPRANPLLRAKMALYLVATSSQYQVQR